MSFLSIKHPHVKFTVFAEFSKVNVDRTKGELNINAQLVFLVSD